MDLLAVHGAVEYHRAVLASKRTSSSAYKATGRLPIHFTATIIKRLKSSPLLEHIGGRWRRFFGSGRAKCSDSILNTNHSKYRWPAAISFIEASPAVWRHKNKVYLVLEAFFELVYRAWDEEGAIINGAEIWVIFILTKAEPPFLLQEIVNTVLLKI